MADDNRGNRPLSPHLSIYRPQMTAVSSIFLLYTSDAADEEGSVDLDGLRIILINKKQLNILVKIRGS